LPVLVDILPFGSSSIKGVSKRFVTSSLQNKKSGFYHLFEYTAPGETISSLEVEFRRDERFMRYLTVKLDKHAISWAERRRDKLKTKA
jgi:small subunit ribosomal protein S6